VILVEERRSQMLIDSPVQLRLVGLVALAGFFTLLLGAAFAWLQWRVLSTALQGTSVDLAAIEGLLWFYGTMSLGAFVIAMSILVMVTLIVTNRIVGPLYRLKEDLQRMLEEETVELISVREQDYIQDFVRELNQFILAIRRTNPEQVAEGSIEFEQSDEIDSILKED
jgi:methyl-accepting chemotaxis protein